MTKLPATLTNPLMWVAVAAMGLAVAGPITGTLSDWSVTLAHAGRVAAGGGNPYSVHGFVSPPWVILLVAPLSLLPDQVSGTVLRLALITALWVTAVRVGGAPTTIGLLLTSVPALEMVYLGDLDALTCLGVIVGPAPLAMLLSLTKPQVGLVAFALRAIENRRTLLIGFVLLAVVAATVLAVGVPLVGTYWNRALFPWGVPVGLGLGAWAYRSKDAGDPRWRNYALMASPLLSPYVTPQAWIGLVLGLVPWPKLMAVVWAGFWAARLFIWAYPP